MEGRAWESSESVCVGRGYGHCLVRRALVASLRLDLPLAGESYRQLQACPGLPNDGNFKSNLRDGLRDGFRIKLRSFSWRVTTRTERCALSEREPCEQTRADEGCLSFAGRRATMLSSQAMSARRAAGARVTAAPGRSSRAHVPRVAATRRTVTTMAAKGKSVLTSQTPPSPSSPLAAALATPFEKETTRGGLSLDMPPATVCLFSKSRAPSFFPSFPFPSLQFLGSLSLRLRPARRPPRRPSAQPWVRKV